MERVVLGGFAGVGKSRVGLELSEQLKVPHFDLDQEIEDGEGKTVQEIIRVDGIDCFRQLEVTYFNEIRTKKKLVLSLGGGSLENKEIRDGVQCFESSIWLCQHPSIITKRLLADEVERPLIKDSNQSAEVAVSNLLLTRLKQYMTMDSRVWIGNGTVGQTVDGCMKSTDGPVIVGALGKPLAVSSDRNERVDALTILGAVLQNEADQYIIQDSGGLTAELLSAVYLTNQQLLDVLFGLYCMSQYSDWEEAFQLSKELNDKSPTFILEQLLSAAFNSEEKPYLIGTNLNLLPGSSAKHIAFNAMACALKAVRLNLSELTAEYIANNFRRLIELTSLDEDEFYSVDEDEQVTSSGSKAMRTELCYCYLKAPACPEVSTVT